MVVSIAAQESSIICVDQKEDWVVEKNNKYNNMGHSATATRQKQPEPAKRFAPSEAVRRREDAVVSASVARHSPASSSGSIDNNKNAPASETVSSAKHRRKQDTPKTEPPTKRETRNNKAAKPTVTYPTSEPWSPMSSETTPKLPPSPLVTPPGCRVVSDKEHQEHLANEDRYHGSVSSHSSHNHEIEEEGRGTKYASRPNRAQSSSSSSNTNNKRKAPGRRKDDDDYDKGDDHSTTREQGSPSSTMAGKRGVPHIYHDYSQMPDVMGYVRKKTGGVTQPFPEKLHEMLNAMEKDTEAHHVVSWLPHGRAFLVRRPKEFTHEVMPRFFRQTKLTSFQRQLNLYGFRRITQGTDAGAYYHEMFLRGRPGLCQRMVRQKVKGTGHKQPADASSEPNFYEMPPLDSPDSPASLLPSEPPPIGAAMPIAMPATTSTTQISVLSPPQRTAGSGEDSPPSTQKRYPTHGFVLGDAKSQTPISPGMQSVRGAAHLLHGIASGVGFSRPFILGPSAAAADQGDDTATATATTKIPTLQEPSSPAASLQGSSSSASGTKQTPQKESSRPASFLPDLEEAEQQESV